MNQFHLFYRCTILLFLLSSVFSCQSDLKKKAPISFLETQIGLALDSIDQNSIEKFEINCSIRAIHPLSSDKCWYAGSKGQFGYTIDAGKTWQIDSLQHPRHENLEFRSIAVTSKSVFLLCVASPAILYKSDNNGQDWHIVYQEDDSLAFYDAMVFWDETTGIAMGDPTDGCLSIIKTTDGGNTWSKIPCTQLPKAEKGEAAFAASNSNISVFGNNVWIVSGGKKARVFFSPDRGVTWSVHETPIVQGGQMTGIFSCAFHDENNGVIIGGDWEDKDINIANKAITSDGGKTWSLLSDGKEPGYRSCIQYINPNNADHLMAVGIPGISYSLDRGTTWTEFSNEDYYTFRVKDNAIWLAGRNKMGRLAF